MSATILALALGTLLAVGALAFVLYPLFFGVPAERDPAPPSARSRGGADQGNEAGLSAVAALREIEFDRATGKLSDDDYAQLKSRYTAEALAAMRREGTGGTGAPPASADEEIEAAVLAYRVRHPECRHCGPRPEVDAVFCSDCGRYLRGACEVCGGVIDEPGSRYCAGCGHSLAA